MLLMWVLFLGWVHLDAADLMPGQLNAKIYSLMFKLLFTSGVDDKLAVSSWTISLLFTQIFPSSHETVL